MNWHIISNYSPFLMAHTMEWLKLTLVLTASHSGYITVPKNNYSSFVWTCKIKMAYRTFWWHLLTSFDVPETAATLALTKARCDIVKQFCHTVVVCLASKFDVLSEFHMFQVFVVLGDQQQCICVLPAKLNCGTIQNIYFFKCKYAVTHNDLAFKTYFNYNLVRQNGWECMKSKHQKDRRMKRGTYMSEVFHLCLWRKIENDE